MRLLKDYILNNIAIYIWWKNDYHDMDIGHLLMVYSFSKDLVYHCGGEGIMLKFDFHDYKNTIVIKLNPLFMPFL